MRIKIQYFICLLAVVAISMTACKTEKQVATGKKAKKLDLKPLEYDYLTIKSKLTFTNEGKDQKVAGYIRMKKDSVIWMSMSKTNVEGVRILVTQDTFLMLDRLGKKYYAYNFESLEDKFGFPFNFKMLQSVLTGELYWEGETLPQPARTSKHFVVKGMIQALDVANYVSRYNQKLAKIEVEDDEKNTLKIEYDEFADLEGQNFAHHNVSKLVYVKDDAQYEMNLELEYKRVNLLDKELKFPFKISSKYEKAE